MTMRTPTTLLPYLIAGALAIPAAANTYTVTTTSDSGAGSLRQAILDANAHGGVDSIDFNIAGGGVHLILPLSPLPYITETVSIDGWTQPNFAGTPVIEIGGDNAGLGANGLVLIDNSSQIRGLIINGFSGMGIYITGTGNASIFGCYIGIYNDGVSSTYPNGSHGIFIEDSPNNDIGDTSIAGHRNIISNNGGYGVYILGAASTGNVVANNYIGTDVTGTVAVPNTLSGVMIEDAPNNTVGGTTTAARNVVSANTESGVRITGFGATGNVVEGNYVGTDAAGNAALGNGFHGIYLVDTDDNTVGGTAAGAGNLVSGNAYQNIRVQDCGGTGTRVQGNIVGLNADGTTVIGGTAEGISITRSHNCLVGGGTASARNVAAGNNTYNIEVITFSEGTTVQGNYIGTDITGSVALGGGTYAGLSIFNVCDITITDNVISGNTSDGVFIWGSNSSVCGTPNVIQNNRIGVGANGATPLGNGDQGIYVTRKTNQRIGGTGAGEPNTIAYNGGAGVLIANDAYLGDPASQVQISANTIHDNGGLGIDLSMDAASADGVTPNDTDDPDVGANNFQNFPVITSAHGDASSLLTVVGSLNSTPSMTFRVEVFGNDTCDPSGNGEGRYYLGYFDVVTNSGGDASFSQIVNTVRSFASDWLLTTTARNLATDDTSEFSACVPIDSDFCGTGAGSCYVAGGNGSAGCENTDCCNSVCDVDPYCCDVDWDNLCAQEAVMICANGGNEQSGDCFTPNPTAGCYDPECVQTVCASDPYCCDTEWDSICADEALSMCTLPCPGDIPFVSPGTVDVEDLLYLLSQWSAAGPPRPRADVDPYPTGDNIVNVNDLLNILANWGPCP